MYDSCPELYWLMSIEFPDVDTHLDTFDESYLPFQSGGTRPKDWWSLSSKDQHLEGGPLRRRHAVVIGRNNHPARGKYRRKKNVWWHKLGDERRDGKEANAAF